MARLLVILTFALAMLVGCGGDDDDSGGDGGGGGETMTQEEFVNEANKICREGSEKLEGKTSEVQEKVQGADTPQEQQKVVADVLEDVKADYDPYLDRLHDLNPPENISADWDKFLAGIDKAFGLIGDLADATRDGDQAKLQGLTDDFTQIANDTRPFAEKYKLDDCMPDDSPTGS